MKHFQICIFWFYSSLFIRNISLGSRTQCVCSKQIRSNTGTVKPVGNCGKLSLTQSISRFDINLKRNIHKCGNVLYVVKVRLFLSIDTTKVSFQNCILFSKNICCCLLGSRLRPGLPYCSTLRCIYPRSSVMTDLYVSMKLITSQLHRQPGQCNLCPLILNIKSSTFIQLFVV